MTSPTYATGGPGGRWYEIPAPPLPAPFRGPSVTTIIKQGIPSPALGYWMRNTALEYAVDHVDSWGNLDRAAALDLLKREPDRQRDRAGDTGTDVHAMCEALLKGEPLGDWTKPYAPWLEHFHKFLADWNVTPLYVERTVVRTNGATYAGSFDFIADIDGEIVLGDIKTSKGVYPETGLQLAAYACADVMLSGDGRTCEPMPHVHSLGILHLRETGYGWYPIEAPTEPMFRSFLAAHEVAMFKIEHAKRVLAKVPAEPPNRPAIRTALIDRVRQIIEWGGSDELAGAWPVDIPTFKQSTGHTLHQLDAIDHLLTRIENRVRPAPATATPERHEGAIAQLLALDPDAFTTVEKYAGHIPNLKTGRATDDQLDHLNQIIACVVKAPNAEDRAARAGRATHGRTTNVAELTPAEVEAFLRTRKTRSVS